MQCAVLFNNVCVPSAIVERFMEALPALYIGRASMVCVPLRDCAMLSVPRIARSFMRIAVREGESVWRLLFAMYMQELMGPLTVHHGHCSVYTFGGTELGCIGNVSTGTCEPCEVIGLEDAGQPVDITATYDTTAVCFLDGTLYTFGHEIARDYAGRGHPLLGRGQCDSHDASMPAPVTGKHGDGDGGQRTVCAKQVSMGGGHMAIVTNDGHLCTCGESAEGKLGHGPFTSIADDEYSPRVVEGLVGKRVVSASASMNHTVAMTDHGEVFTWGCGNTGKLGHGCADRTKEYFPKRVEGLVGKRVVCISAGLEHTAAVTDRGELFTWGWNFYGQCGLSETGDGESSYSKNAFHTPQCVDAFAGKRMVRVACGHYFTLALSSEGEVYAFGYASHGQLGVGERDIIKTPTRVEALVGHRVVQIAAGAANSAMVTSRGELFTCGKGSNWAGGTSDSRCVHTPQPVEFFEGMHVVAVACGYRHMVVLVESGA